MTENQTFNAMPIYEANRRADVAGAMQLLEKHYPGAQLVRKATYMVYQDHGEGRNKYIVILEHDGGMSGGYTHFNAVTGRIGHTKVWRTPSQSVGEYKHKKMNRTREPYVIFSAETFEAEGCSCKPGIERDNCPRCEGTGKTIDFNALYHTCPKCGKRGSGIKYKHETHGCLGAETFESDQYGWASTMLRDLKLLIEDIENAEVYHLSDCLQRLKEIRDDDSHFDAEMDIVADGMAVVSNKGQDIVGVVEAVDDEDDDEMVELSIQDENMKEIGSFTLDDGQLMDDSICPSCEEGVRSYSDFCMDCDDCLDCCGCGYCDNCESKIVAEKIKNGSCPSCDKAFDSELYLSAEGMDFTEAAKTGYGIGAGLTLWSLTLGVGAVLLGGAIAMFLDNKE